MNFIPFPAAEIEPLMDAVDQDVLDLSAYQRLGVQVIRKAVPAQTIAAWQRDWAAFAGETLSRGRALDPYNPVVVQEVVPDSLAQIYKAPPLLDLMEQVYPDLAVYTHRFLMKGANDNAAPVFLHQDYCYDLGWPEKTSLFLPLSPMSPDNGGLAFYPGTHCLGYLGDAGELSADILDPRWPVVRPVLDPGDVVLMHECTWHSSAPLVRGPDRVVLQVTYQPASDPSGIEGLRGRCPAAFPLGAVERHRLFVRSRSSRLRDLQASVKDVR